MTHKVVVTFTTNNARIASVADASAFVGNPNAVVDPDLGAVRGLPPHYWKLVAGKVLPMTEDEKKERDAHHEKFGVDNGSQPTAPAIYRRHHSYVSVMVVAVAVSLAVTALTDLILRHLH